MFKYSLYNVSSLSKLQERVKKLENKIDDLEETVAILSDKKLLKSIKEGLNDLKFGRYKVYKSVEEMKRDFAKKRIR